MILFLLAAGHGLFLATVLAIKSSTSNSLIYLSLLLLAFSISILYYVSYWTGYSQSVSPFWGLILTFPTFYGPLMLGFVRRISGDKLPLRHFGLFALHFLYMLGFYGQLQGFWQSSLFDTRIPLGLVVIQNIFLMIYAVLAFRELGNVGKHQCRGVRLILWFYCGFVASYACYYILVFTIEFQPQHDYFISVTMCCFMFLIGYLSFDHNLMLPRGGAYLKSGFSTALSSHYKKQLLEFMEHQKPFTNGDLKLPQLATSLGMTPHNLSEMVNKEFDMNFSEFLNRYRVCEAKKIMKSQAGTKLKLIEIAYLVGFNNKTTFSQAFKRQTGYTPSEFRANQLGSPVAMNVRN